MLEWQPIARCAESWQEFIPMKKNTRRCVGKNARKSRVENARWTTDRWRILAGSVRETRWVWSIAWAASWGVEMSGDIWATTILIVKV